MIESVSSGNVDISCHFSVYQKVSDRSLGPGGFSDGYFARRTLERAVIVTRPVGLYACDQHPLVALGAFGLR